MSKTKELTIECKSVNIEPDYTPKKVIVTLFEPNINDMLAGMDRMDLVEWMCENHSPQDIFADNQLKKWAEQNGYIKE